MLQTISGSKELKSFTDIIVEIQLNCVLEYAHFEVLGCLKKEAFLLVFVPKHNSFSVCFETNSCNRKLFLGINVCRIFLLLLLLTRINLSLIHM